MAEKDKGTDKRMTLAVTEVKERQPIGEKGAVKLNFKAKGEDGDKEFWYFTFSQRLFETIEQGKGRELECDVNISTREWDGNTYIDRKVTQIYIEGQPVGGRRPGGYQESPETRASIERMSKMGRSTELWIAGKFDGNSPEVKKLRGWIMEDDAPVVAPKVETPKAEKAKPQASKAAPKAESDNGTAKLLSRVSEVKGFKSDKTARTWLINVCKIDKERIDTAPEKVLAEVEQLF